MRLCSLLLYFMLLFNRIVAFRAVVPSFLRQVSRRPVSSVNTTESIVYVGNLPLEYSLDRFNQFAASKGLVGFTSRLVMQGQKFRGFGYLDFNTPEEANRAVSKLIDSEVDGRKLKIDVDAGTDGPTKGRRPSLFTDEHSIFIGNLAFTLERADIQQFIEEELGKVKMKIRLATGDNLRSKGYCHVDFTNKEDMELALSKLNLLPIRGRELNVERSIPRVRSKPDDTEDEDNDGVTRFVSRSADTGGRPRRPVGRDYDRPGSGRGRGMDRGGDHEERGRSSRFGRGAGGGSRDDGRGSRGYGERGYSRDYSDGSSRRQYSDTGYPRRKKFDDKKY